MMTTNGNVRRFVFVVWPAALLLWCSGLLGATGGILCAAETDATLPNGVKAVWDLDKAFREKTATRERLCLNGLWRWQPAADENLPAGGWGFFKVPACWPGITDYLQYDFQTVYPHPDWKNVKMREISAAWYQREFTVPADWTGRRVVLSAEYLNSFATVFVDGKQAGEMRFPAGELDLTALCPAGSKHVLSLHVLALPLKGVMISYNDTNTAKEVKGTVERRGLCGDVWLVATPAGARIADLKVDTSVRKGEITFTTKLENLAAEKKYSLWAEIFEDGKILDERKKVKVLAKGFSSSDVKDGKFSFGEKWLAKTLWDIHTPQNFYQVRLSLEDESLDDMRHVVDELPPMRFGFREFWIDGRDFYLNGSRIFLSALPIDNAQIGAALATYDAAKETMLRLKSFGINCVYTHNYDCNPGSHLSFEEILRAADDVGMLVSLSQPHFSNYDWKKADADATNGYARHAEFYVHVAANHPSVVFYSMSHNATGYNEDTNPDKIDGKPYERDKWAANNVKSALRAEAIVQRLDPSRIVYHHSSGNLSSMHTMNFYTNFVPIQEMDDWFEHWATEGVKPAFTCEYGVPFTWDWTMYRGWYNGKRSFGNAQVPWEYCVAEWNAQFLGDRAFQITESEKQNLRFEAKQFKAGKVFFRWDYPTPVGERLRDDEQTIIGKYTTDNWRAFRTWGLSANSPWDCAGYWKPRDGINRNRVELKTDWDNLQRPGFSPDYLEKTYERMDVAFERRDWVPTASAQALIRNNQPLLAYIAGKPSRFTSKDHNFLPGETVEKQLVVINNSRETVSCNCGWFVVLAERTKDSRVDAKMERDAVKFNLPTGEQKRIPIRFNLTATEASGAEVLEARVSFDNGKEQKDSFLINILPPQPAVNSSAKIAIFDPKGETTKLLGAIGVTAQTVDASADLSPFDVLVVGKAALTTDGAAPSIARVRDGLKVVLFEQTSDVLEKRFGFRTTEYGLRNVFKRVPDHPLLAVLDTENLRDWRGEATILPPRLNYKLNEKFNGAPTVKWLGMDVTRLWRNGNRGNVASVLIEKPARGDFLPVLDGGYSLQYSPLMEYREGKGMILFCQMDVTGRTEADPAADRLTRNIFNYAADWKAVPTRKAFYVGDERGKQLLQRIGVSAADYNRERLSDDQLLVIGPSGGEALTNGLNAPDSIAALGASHVLTLGLDEADATMLKIAVKKIEHIATYFEPQNASSPFAGIGPADVHNRDTSKLPLVTGGATILGDGVLAQNGNVVFCQLAPWQFDYSKQYNLKRTFRRTSFLVTRLLANMGVSSSTPILERFSAPVDAAKNEKRWLDGLYLDAPEEMDDPYRFFGW